MQIQIPFSHPKFRRSCTRKWVLQQLRFQELYISSRMLWTRQFWISRKLVEGRNSNEGTFWTLIEWDVEQNMRLAFIACANRRAYCQKRNENILKKRTCFVISSWSSLGKLTRWSNFVPTRNGIAVCIKGGSEKEETYLIESSCLSIPFFDWI